MRSSPALAGTAAGTAQDGGGLSPELAPVALALRREAERTARSIRSDAESQALATMSRSYEEAESILARARRDGRDAGRAAGSRRSAEAHRQAREVVLAVRQAAHRRLRSNVISGVEQQLGGRDGRTLRSYLVELVGRAAGGPAEEASGPGGRWRAVAVGPAGRAAMDVETLVDQVLPRFSTEISHLWS